MHEPVNSYRTSINNNFSLSTFVTEWEQTNHEQFRVSNLYTQSNKTRLISTSNSMEIKLHFAVFTMIMLLTISVGHKTSGTE